MLDLNVAITLIEWFSNVKWCKFYSNVIKNYHFNAR